MNEFWAIFSLADTGRDHSVLFHLKIQTQPYDEIKPFNKMFFFHNRVVEDGTLLYSDSSQSLSSVSQKCEFCN
jgi:hypothetical protein